MHKVNSFVFCPEDYDKKESEMYADIADVLKILFKCRYTCTIRREDFGIVVIEYDYLDGELGTYTPVWVDYDEFEMLMSYRREKDEVEDE